jgi:cation diffusion facilitator CzcD-associated flavoprotein CzcO
VLPRPDINFGEKDRASPEFARQQKARRIEWFNRFEVIARSRFPMNSEVIAGQEAVWKEQFDAQVRDPHAREVLTPHYRFGCKRPLFSSLYYPTFERDNVKLVGRGVSHLHGGSIVDVEGDRYEVDMVIWATGFEPTGMLGGLVIRGRDGRELADEWREIPHAYFGTMVEGFPNFFLINGPNAGGASVTDVVEAQVGFILASMMEADRRGSRTVEVDPAVYERYNVDIQARADASVMVRGNCNSYYRIGGNGKVFTHWPDTIEAFRTRMKTDAPDGVVYRAVRTVQGA